LIKEIYCWLDRCDTKDDGNLNDDGDVGIDGGAPSNEERRGTADLVRKTGKPMEKLNLVLQRRREY
jgi:hypothetical protein